MWVNPKPSVSVSGDLEGTATSGSFVNGVEDVNGQTYEGQGIPQTHECHRFVWSVWDSVQDTHPCPLRVKSRFRVYMIYDGQNNNVEKKKKNDPNEL